MPNEGGLSVGQLLQMHPTSRVRAIKVLPRKTRMRLAHLAVLGLSRDMAKIEERKQLLFQLTQEYND